jgi:glycosyltransferase involved in cell wall biosynthesis
VQRLAQAGHGIEVTGRVPAVQPFLWGAALAVAPLHVARGIQNKVLEAIAAGLPAIVTTAVFEGLPAEARAGCIRADAPAEVAEAVLGVLSLNPGDRRRMAGEADVSSLSWARRLAGLRPLLEGAAGLTSGAG